ncbi:hypothetical protein ILYODFUR_015264 [Ilyodon furcidens]|uniref:Uncharacterized protein n=1 Tax=Ilyodon furcidens TaxID=33524 RepID=A0ABV0UV02_9TELE
MIRKISGKAEDGGKRTAGRKPWSLLWQSGLYFMEMQRRCGDTAAFVLICNPMLEPSELKVPRKTEHSQQTQTAKPQMSSVLHPGDPSRV